MRFTIPIEIDCGVKTCASESEKFCSMLRTSVIKDGTCALFGPVFEKDGWIMRHPVCKAGAIENSKFLETK